MLSHFLAYPIALAWAVAAIPPTIWVHVDDLMRDLDEAQLSKTILRLLVGPTLTAFVLAHVVAIPWVDDAAVLWRRRLYVYGEVTLAILGVLAAIVGWAILLTQGAGPGLSP